MLPIGSVVILKNGNKMIMIYGHKQIRIEDRVKYDYIGCFYPEGYFSARGNVFFNHQDVGQLIFKGYEEPKQTAVYSNRLAR